MAERHAGTALWECYGLLHGLHAVASDSAQKNKIFDGIADLDIIGKLIGVPPPEGATLTALIPQFSIPVPASVPLNSQAVSSGKKKCTPDDRAEALELCASILADIDQMPEQAEEYIDGIKPKVMDMQEFVNRTGYVSEKQLKSLHNMRDGQLRWLEREDD